MAPSPSLSPPRRRSATHVHLNYHIHRDAYDLLVAECPATPSGRKVGMAQVLERCIYMVLGSKKVTERLTRQ